MTAGSAIDWSLPPDALELSRGQVHVWRVDLDGAAPHLDRLSRLLDDQELAQARRLRGPEHRDRFIARRGALRAVLGGYLDVDPAALSFRRLNHGKPVLLAPGATADLRFNVSDSHGLALLAVAPGLELGVDLERIREGPSDEQIARRFFAPAEYAALQGLAPQHRRDAFFRCWTRKEAYLKARGVGLAMGLARFEVSVLPGEPAALRRCDEDPAELARWSLRDLEPGDGYIGCLAAQGQGWELRCWRWEHPRR